MIRDSTYTNSMPKQSLLTETQRKFPTETQKEEVKINFAGGNSSSEDEDEGDDIVFNLEKADSNAVRSTLFDMHLSPVIDKGVAAKNVSGVGIEEERKTMT